MIFLNQPFNFIQGGLGKRWRKDVRSFLLSSFFYSSVPAPINDPAPRANNVRHVIVFFLLYISIAIKNATHPPSNKTIPTVLVIFFSSFIFFSASLKLSRGSRKEKFSLSNSQTYKYSAKNRKCQPSP